MTTAIHQYAQDRGMQEIVAVHVHQIHPREEIRIPVAEMIDWVVQSGHVVRPSNGKPCDVSTVEWADGYESFASWYQYGRTADEWRLRSCSDSLLIGFVRPKAETVDAK